jgi:hypothetical protein
VVEVVSAVGSAVDPGGALTVTSSVCT